MTYVGIQTQIRRNNFNSVLLMLTFPLILLGMVYAFLYLYRPDTQDPQIVNETFILPQSPFVLIGTFNLVCHCLVFS